MIGPWKPVARYPRGRPHDRLATTPNDSETVPAEQGLRPRLIGTVRPDLASDLTLGTCLIRDDRCA
jgi:hypothetical protein